MPDRETPSERRAETPATGFLTTPSTQARSWLTWLAPAAVLVFYSPLLFAPSGSVMDAPDFTRYFVPIHEFARRSLLAGRWPLWNPYNYAGLPFAANPQTMVFYPLSWLYLAIPVLDAHRFLIVIHALLATLTMRIYLERIGADRVSSLAGCLPYGLGGYFATNAASGHLTMIFTMAWLPLILYFYEGWRRFGRKRDLVRCGLAFALQVIAGEPQSSYYTVLLFTAQGIAGIGIGSGLSRRGPRMASAFRAASAFFAVGLIATLASAVLLLPAMEMVGQSDRGGTSFEFSTVLSMPFESLIAGVFLPWYSGSEPVWADAVGHIPLNLNREFAIYVGIVPLLLASLMLRSSSFHARLAKYVLVAAALLMLGSHTPLYRFAWEALPGLSFFRIPARANLLFLWSLCVMSALGAARLRSGEAPSKRWRWCAMGALILPMLVLILRTALGLWRLSPSGRLGIVPALDPLLTLPFATLGAVLMTVIALPRMSRRTMVASLLTLLTLDLFVARPLFPLRTSSPEAAVSDRLYESLRRPATTDVEPFRVDLAPSHASALGALAFGTENVNGYWPVSLKRTFAYVHEMRGVPPSPVTRHQFFDRLYESRLPFPLPLLNVRFASWLDRASGSLVVVENPKVTPRAWMVERTETIADDRATLSRMKDPGFDPLLTVLLTRAPPFPPAPPDGSAGTARLRGIRPEELRIATESSRDGWLVVSLPSYPGWIARVDAGEVTTERADYLITALPIKRGSHEVVLSYEPWTFRLGAGLTLATVACALMFEVWLRRHARPYRKGEGAVSA